MSKQYQRPAIPVLSCLMAGGASMAEPAESGNKEKPAPAATNPKATAGKSTTDSAKAILGTWINKAYNGQGRSGRIVYTLGANGKTLEVQSGVEKIDPKGERYSIYHKQGRVPGRVRHEVPLH